MLTFKCRLLVDAASLVLVTYSLAVKLLQVPPKKNDFNNIPVPPGMMAVLWKCDVTKIRGERAVSVQ